ncbi:MAG TPA: RNA-binding S4 domain-containing protein [Saprospiraceae bacterium]|nr:RNA-binding S4 domain-containing protein [Saprospiraceae bacterium]
MMEKTRIDKWLWAVRIFKSRTLATDACKSGKVRILEKEAKPAQMVDVGNEVEVRKNGFQLRFKVLRPIDKRVSAPLAAECYTNLTSEEELQKYANWFTGKAQMEYRDRGAGRPTKKERRQIDDHKTTLFNWDEWDEA